MDGYFVMMYDRQRILDARWLGLLAVHGALAVIPSKLWNSTWYDNVQRVGTPLVFWVIAVWIFTCSNDHYRRNRNIFVMLLRVVVPAFPAWRTTQFMLTRIQISPKNHWAAAYIGEPFQLLLGTALILPIELSLVPLPLWMTVIAQVVGVLGVRQNVNVCSSKLLSSYAYERKIGMFTSMMNGFTDAVVSACGYPYITSHELTPVEACSTTVNFMLITVGALFPLCLMLWLAPPIVVLGCLNTRIDRVIVSLGSWFINPNKELLIAAAIDDDADDEEPHLRSRVSRVLHCGVLLAVVWQCALLVM